MSIEHALRNIEEDRLDEKQLLSLLNNAIEKNHTVLIDKIKLKLRIKHPRAANKRFGSKERDVVDTLTATYNMVKEQFDLIGNNVKNGVKAGGPMKTGERYLCYYISYKNDQGHACALTVNQKTVDSEVYCIVKDYVVGDDTQIVERRFDMGLYNEAVLCYIQLLKEIVGEVNE